MEVLMPQRERKDKETDRGIPSDENRNQQGLQRNSGRGESLWRDPFAGFWSGRDPFAAFWEPFGLMTRNASPFQTGRPASSSPWAPQMETFQRGNEFVVRTDLPGINKDDVKIDITDDSITIEGERREEHEEDREGYYRSERSYGSFYRVVPLPDGAITDSAKANFNNGVLEVVVQAPPREVSRGRRLEIGESSGAARGENRNQNRSEKERSEAQR
jgi:HSP20 family protein